MGIKLIMFSSDEILKQLEPKSMEGPVFEIQINCLKMDRPKNFKIKKKGFQNGAKYYKIQRPLVGKMNIGMFCMYCEKDYNLIIKSREETKFNYVWHISMIIIILFPFISWGLRYGYIAIPYFIYYLFKMKSKWNIYLETSKSHSYRVIREYRAIDVDFI